MKTLVRLFAAVALVGFTRAAGAQDLGIKVGEKAPAAMVQTLAGQSVDLSKYYGSKPVVLEFWATWCPLCKQLEPSLQAARLKYADRVAFVGVGVPASQTAEKQKAYVDQQKMAGDFVFDKDGMAMKAFAVPHTSYLVVINKTGHVVYTGVGGDQDVEAAMKKAMQ